MITKVTKCRILKYSWFEVVGIVRREPAGGYPTQYNSTNMFVLLYVMM
jgi:hypothetical protein